VVLARRIRVEGLPEWSRRRLWKIDGRWVAGLKGRGIGCRLGGRSVGIDVTAAGEAQAPDGA
jgi:hypothetical protein